MRVLVTYEVREILEIDDKFAALGNGRMSNPDKQDLYNELMATAFEELELDRVFDGRLVAITDPYTNNELI